MSGLEFAIVADDLTGAADSCANLAKTGRRTAVFFEGEGGGEGFEAVAFDTDSRCAPPDEARRRVLEAGEKARPATIVYKKIDSTLRGNLAVEIAAMMEATGRERAVVAPAFPHAGRATLGGTQLLHGTPVHETELARDPKTPVRESHLPTILFGLGRVGSLALDDLADPADPAGAVRRAVEGNLCVVADATGDAHLRSLVRAVPEPSRVLWVGSAGLASALPPIIHPGDGETALPPPREAYGGGVLVVVGSLSEVSRRQLRSLERRAGVFLASVEDASGLYDAKGFLRSGGCVALRSPSGAGAFSPGEVAGMLAEAAASLEGSFGSLVLTGGDTALAVARRLGAKGIEVFGEVEPGVPFGRVVGRKPYPVVTKAGGFGHPATLCDAVEFLSGVAGRSVKG